MSGTVSPGDVHGDPLPQTLRFLSHGHRCLDGLGLVPALPSLVGEAAT